MVGDLFVDLRNGHNLITLLEILTQEPLVSKNYTNFYMYPNAF